MPDLFGISGRKGHGKDTFAKLVVEANPNFTLAPFAGALKVIAGKVFHLSHDQMYDPILKETCFPHPIIMDDYLDFLKAETGLELQPANVTAHSPREILQFLGTEYVRKVNPNYWIQRVLKEVTTTSQILVTDTRFPNEADAVRSKGGKVIKILRIDMADSRDTHASESEVDSIEPDLLLGVRTGDLSLLRKVAGYIATGKFGKASRYDYRNMPAIFAGNHPKGKFPVRELLKYYRSPAK